MRPLLQQQNRFNQLTVQRLHDHDVRLLEQDREQTTATHDLAELTTQLRQTNRRLAAIERRLRRLEAQLDAEDEDEQP